MTAPLTVGWFGDLLTKPLSKGGLGFGTIGSSAGLAVILAVLIVATRKPPAEPPLDNASET